MKKIASKIALIFWTLILFVFSLFANFVYQTDNTLKPVQASHIEINAQSFLATLNRHRQDKGLQPLIENPLLSKIALSHASDMRTRGYYNHTTPEGVTSYTRIDDKLMGQYYAGENEDNLCYDSTVQKEIKRFSESIEHEANQLDTKYNNVGVGVVVSDQNKCNGYIVIDFAQV